MNTTAKPPTKSRSIAKRGRSYRGVKLQPPSTPPKMSRRRQLQEAVEYAIAKNATALAERK